jgi:hypothetical protein
MNFREKIDDLKRGNEGTGWDLYLAKYMGRWCVLMRWSHCGGTEYEHTCLFTDDEARKIVRDKLLDVWEPNSDQAKQLAQSHQREKNRNDGR